MGCESIVVVLDASSLRDRSWKEIREVLHGLLLNPGDKLTLLGVLHSVINPCKSILHHNLIKANTINYYQEKNEQGMRIDYYLIKSGH